MKMRRLLSVITSAVMAITSVTLTAIFTSADTSLNFNSKWSFSGNVSSVLDIDQSTVGSSYYTCIKNYDEYKALKSKGLIRGYNKSFFNQNVLLVNWLNSYNGRRGAYKNPEITKGTNGTLTCNYRYNMSYPSLDWDAYEKNMIEFKKSEVSGVDFSDITVNVTIDYSNTEYDYPDENVTLKMVNVLNYSNTIKTNNEFNFKLKTGKNRNFYFIIDNYKDYTACGFTGKKAKFFKSNILLVNCFYNSKYTCDSFVNKGMVKNIENTLIMSYNAVWKYPKPKKAEQITDIIELKKSEVKNVDFSKLTVYKRNKYDTWTPGKVPPSDTFFKLKMTYVDVSSVIANIIKNSQVKNLTGKSNTKKKITVTWKNVSGACGYEVMYATNKKFTKGKKIVRVKKNKVTLKKLKAKKKYFVKVRAYKNVTKSGTKCVSKRYGKWSKVVKKTT